MNIVDLHRDMMKRISPQDVAAVIQACDPYVATSLVRDLLSTNEPDVDDIAKACAIIDSLDPLTAAFIITILTEEARNTTGRAESILKYAENLRIAGIEIKGLRGLCHARDEIYRKTGIFAM